MADTAAVVAQCVCVTAASELSRTWMVCPFAGHSLALRSSQQNVLIRYKRRIGEVNWVTFAFALKTKNL